MPQTRLTGRAHLEIRGPDAEHFLQNVITTDLDKLEPGVAMPGALLTPQGKILTDFLIARNGTDGFRIETDIGLAPALKQRLAMYKLRAKAEIHDTDESVTSVSWQDDSSSSRDDSSLRDGRFPREYNVFRMQGGDLDSEDEGAEAWQAFRIEQGIAECGTDYEPGSAFPHDVLMDKNGGVSFRKGCFIGQEVVSRMQHRGTARKRIMIARTAANMPMAGTIITAGGKTVGELASVCGKSALAMVRTDRLGEAVDDGSSIVAGETEVKLAFPEWAALTLPSATPGGEG